MVKRAPSQPKPFSRASIDLDASVKRSWQTVPASQLAVGDMVQYAGKIRTVSTVGDKTLLEFQSGSKGLFDSDETLFSFTATNG